MLGQPRFTRAIVQLLSEALSIFVSSVLGFFAAAAVGSRRRPYVARRLRFRDFPAHRSSRDGVVAAYS